MNTSLSVGLFTVLSTVLAAAALCWGLARRRMSASDDAMFSMLDDGEPDFSRTASAASPHRARVLLALLTCVFLLIAASVFVTVMAASGKSVPGVTASPGKCPI